MAAETWCYAQARGHLIRWRGEDGPATVPASLEVLTPGGWCGASFGLARHLWRNGRNDVGADDARRRVVQACSHHAISDASRTGLGGLLAGSGVRWLLSPPLRMGSPRRLTIRLTDAAEEAFREQLGDGDPGRLLDGALAGWKRGLDRHAGVERRSQAFFQGAGLTTTLVLANGALLRGEDRVEGTLAWIVLSALLLATVALLVAGVYGLFGSMHTFGRVTPNNLRRVVERAREDDAATAQRREAAVVFLAQRRTSIVGDWKLARLKRAMWWLLIGVTLLAAASAALVVDVLA